jgi:hypothetical protein
MFDSGAVAATFEQHQKIAPPPKNNNNNSIPQSTMPSSAQVEQPQQQPQSASALLAKRERRLRLEKVGSYRVGRTLGRGNFAQVRIAYHEIANVKVCYGYEHFPKPYFRDRPKYLK